MGWMEKSEGLIAAIRQQRLKTKREKRKDYYAEQSQNTEQLQIGQP